MSDFNAQYGAVQDWLADRPEFDFIEWPDPRLAQIGHDPRDAYSERFWLPAVGPSALWLARWFATLLDEFPGKSRRTPVDVIAESIGLSRGTGRNAPVVKTISRLGGFGLVEPRAEMLFVRTRWPELGGSQLGRLPAWLARQHNTRRSA